MAAKKSSKTSKESSEKAKAPERANIGDIEKIIVELAKKGHSPSEIGIILKEKHGVYDIKVIGKKITKIIKDAGIKHKTDLDFVVEKLGRIEKHYGKNRQDKRAKREVVRYVSKKRRLEMYNNSKSQK
ncbi:MAG: hypothetical protein AABX03_05055 [Nanoarchaeota archaeon]